MVRRGTEPASVNGLSAPMVFVTFKPDGVHTNQAHPEPKAVLPDITVSSDEECRLNDAAQVQINFIKEDRNSYSASYIR